jgi:hypothetical protein
MKKVAVQPGGFFSLMALLSGGRQLRLPQGLVANGRSTYQQLEFRRKSSDISNNILEVWWMATLVLGLSGRRVRGSDLRAKVGVETPREL